MNGHVKFAVYTHGYKISQCYQFDEPCKLDILSYSFAFCDFCFCGSQKSSIKCVSSEYGNIQISTGRQSDSFRLNHTAFPGLLVYKGTPNRVFELLTFHNLSQSSAYYTNGVILSLITVTQLPNMLLTIDQMNINKFNIHLIETIFY